MNQTTCSCNHIMNSIGRPPDFLQLVPKPLPLPVIFNSLIDFEHLNILIDNSKLKFKLFAWRDLWRISASHSSKWTAETSCELSRKRSRTNISVGPLQCTSLYHQTSLTRSKCYKYKGGYKQSDHLIKIFNLWRCLLIAITYT